MKIVNKSKKTILAENVEVAKGFWKKSLGLMFRKGIKEDHCLLMEFAEEGLHGIWMMGMRFPIDIVFLDPGKRAIRIFENAKPLGMNQKTWKVYKPPRPAKWILELRAGAVRKKRTSAGDLLSF